MSLQTRRAVVGWLCSTDRLRSRGRNPSKSLLPTRCWWRPTRRWAVRAAEGWIARRDRRDRCRRAWLDQSRGCEILPDPIVGAAADQPPLAVVPGNPLMRSEAELLEALEDT
jgi:hypothetical protein